MKAIIGNNKVIAFGDITEKGEYIIVNETKYMKNGLKIVEVINIPEGYDKYKFDYINGEFKINTEDYIKKINEEFTNSVDKLTIGITQNEKDSWDKQESEARKVLDGGTSELLGLLKLDTEIVEELASKIVIKADLLSNEIAKILKVKREKLKNLEA